MANVLTVLAIVAVFAAAMTFLWRRPASGMPRVPAELDRYWNRLKEKRRYTRFKENLPAVCRVIEKDAGLYHIFSKDISGEGVCLKIPEILPEGSLLELDISLPGSNPLSFKGEVVWVKETSVNTGRSARTFDTGIKFLEIDPGDREVLFDFLAVGLKYKKIKEGKRI